MLHVSVHELTRTDYRQNGSPVDSEMYWFFFDSLVSVVQEEVTSLPTKWTVENSGVWCLATTCRYHGESSRSSWCSKFFSLYTVYSAETWRSIMPVSLHEEFEHWALLKNSPLYLVANLQSNKSYLIRVQQLFPSLGNNNLTIRSYSSSLWHQNFALSTWSVNKYLLVPCMILTREFTLE